MNIKVFIAMLFLFNFNLLSAQSDSKAPVPVPDNEKLMVLWTSGDKEVASKMVFMYTFNAKKNGWWKDITLLVWGPSAKLLTEDKELQEYVQDMMAIGINVWACKGCSDSYGISDKLEEIGLTVKYTGKELTHFIKNNKVITF